MAEPKEIAGSLVHQDGFVISASKSTAPALSGLIAINPTPPPASTAQPLFCSAKHRKSSRQSRSREPRLSQILAAIPSRSRDLSLVIELGRRQSLNDPAGIQLGFEKGANDGVEPSR
jgi:hypothetical protein